MPENKRRKKGLVVVLIFIVIISILGCLNTKNTKNNTPTVFEVSSTQGTLIEEIDYYEDIILDYQKVIDASLSENSDETIDYSDVMENILSNEDIAYKWNSMSSELIMYNTSDKDSFGYIIKDLNQDNISELFLIDEYYNINAIFSRNDGEVVLVDAFYSRYRGEILNEQYIHIIGSSGADDTSVEIAALSEDGSLRTIKKSNLEVQTTDLSKWAENKVTFFE